jgi:hypothetical protein
MNKEFIFQHEELSKFKSKVRFDQNFIQEFVISFHNFIENVENDCSNLVEGESIKFLIGRGILVFFVVNQFLHWLSIVVVFYFEVSEHFDCFLGHEFKDLSSMILIEDVMMISSCAEPVDKVETLENHLENASFVSGGLICFPKDVCYFKDCEETSLNCFDLDEFREV